MRSIVTLILFFSLSNELFAQKKVALAYGPVQKFKFSESFLNLDIFSADAGGYYALQVPYSSLYSNSIGGIRNYHLAKYNALDMEKSSSFSMDAVEEDGKSYLLTASIKEELYIFSSKENEQQQKTALYVQAVDKKSFVPKQECKKIAEIDFSKDNKYKKSKFGVEFSPDSSKILITYRLLNKDAEMIRNGFMVMDRKFNSLWKLENPTSTEPGVSNYVSYNVDAKGDVYLLLKAFGNVDAYEQTGKLKKKTFISSTRRVKRTANYMYKVLAFAAGRQTNAYVLSQPGKFITDTELAVSTKGDIVLTGLYADAGRTSVKGTFSMKIAKNAKDITKRISPFWKRLS